MSAGRLEAAGRPRRVVGTAAAATETDARGQFCGFRCGVGNEIKLTMVFKW